MACLFSALQVTKQENVLFSSAFLSVALSKRDQGVFKKCYFCFLLSIPTPLNVRRKVPGSSQVLAISLHLEVPFRKSQQSSGQSSGPAAVTACPAEPWTNCRPTLQEESHLPDCT